MYVQDSSDHVIARVDLGQSTLRDEQNRTVAEFTQAGEVKGHSGEFLGQFEPFSFSQMQNAALYLTLIDPVMLEETAQVGPPKPREANNCVHGGVRGQCRRCADREEIETLEEALATSQKNTAVAEADASSKERELEKLRAELALMQTVSAAAPSGTQRRHVPCTCPHTSLRTFLHVYLHASPCIHQPTHTNAFVCIQARLRQRRSRHCRRRL